MPRENTEFTRCWCLSVYIPLQHVSRYYPPYMAEAVRLLAQHTEQLNINTDAVAAWKELLEYTPFHFVFCLIKCVFLFVIRQYYIANVSVQ